MCAKLSEEQRTMKTLISLRTGKVVGVNTASRRSSQNTNFAVPMGHACRILALLRQGRDPSPPELPFLFYLDLDENNELTVAKVFGKQHGLALREGDVVRRVSGTDGEIQNRDVYIGVDIELACYIVVTIEKRDFYL